MGVGNYRVRFSAMATWGCLFDRRDHFGVGLYYASTSFVDSNLRDQFQRGICMRCVVHLPRARSAKQKYTHLAFSDHTPAGVSENLIPLSNKSTTMSLP